MAVANDAKHEIGDSFAENGYYLAKQVFDEQTLAKLESDFDRIVGQIRQSGEKINARWEGTGTDALDGGASEILHTHNVQRYSAAWLSMLQDARFLDIAEQIIGPDIVLHHTKLFQKPPNSGAPFPMHQDWTYFPARDDTMIAGIVFLSDANARSGGLHAYPGSHKLGRIAESSGRTPNATLDRYPLNKATAVDAQRGDLFFFSYLTLHGSTPNTSSQHRKTVLAQLYSGRDLIPERADHNHVNERLVLRGWNHEMSRESAAE